MSFGNHKQTNKRNTSTHSFSQFNFRMSEAVEFYALYFANVLNLSRKTECPDWGFVCLSSHPLDECCWITLT